MWVFFLAQNILLGRNIFFAKKIQPLKKINPHLKKNTGPNFFLHCRGVHNKNHCNVCVCVCVFLLARRVPEKITCPNSEKKTT